MPNLTESGNEFRSARSHLAISHLQEHPLYSPFEISVAQTHITGMRMVTQFCSYLEPDQSIGVRCTIPTHSMQGWIDGTKSGVMDDHRSHSRLYVEYQEEYETPKPFARFTQKPSVRFPSMFTLALYSPLEVGNRLYVSQLLCYFILASESHNPNVHVKNQSKILGGNEVPVLHLKAHELNLQNAEKLRGIIESVVSSKKTIAMFSSRNKALSLNNINLIGQRLSL